MFLAFADTNVNMAKNVNNNFMCAFELIYKIKKNSG